MRKIKIVADSSADILKLEGVEYDFATMKIICEDREFVDDASLDVYEMQAFFDKYNGKSKTSCPNMSDWLAAFGDADDIFCVTITSGLSGSYNSACAAKAEYESEHTDRRVFVIDSLSAGPEVSLLVHKLKEYIENDTAYEQICEDIIHYRESTALTFMLKSLKNFANNGRVSPAVAKIAGLVGICIVGKASDEGTLEPTHKCRGEARSLDAILNTLKSAGLSSGRVSIAHNQNEAGAATLKGMIESHFPSAQVEIHKLQGLCCFYAERGGLLVGYEKM